MKILSLYLLQETKLTNIYGAYLAPYYAGDVLHHITIGVNNNESIDKLLLCDNKLLAETKAKNRAFGFIEEIINSK